jgi:hypothetical protein
MTVRTLVNWNRSLDIVELEKLDAQALVYKNEGLTDATYTVVIFQDQTCYQRTWVDEPAAQAWITFVNTYSPAPVFAETAPI